MSFASGMRPGENLRSKMTKAVNHVTNHPKRFKAFANLVCSLAILLFIAGCGSEPPAPPEPDPVTISFGEALTINQGEENPAWLHDEPGKVQSVFPVISTNHAAPRLIGVAGKTYPMKHGLVDVTLDLPDGPLRVCVIRLKDREYHRANPAELRRSEARKWASVLKGPANSGVDFLLFVEAFAEQDSAPMKALTDGLPVSVLPVADASGSMWTHQEEDESGTGGSQHRWSFALANRGAAARVRASELAGEGAGARSIQLEFSP